MNVKKNIGTLKKKICGDFAKYGLVMIIGFCMLGMIGLMVALGVTIAVPFFIGMAGNGGGLRFSWGNLSGMQKGGLGLFLILLMPFMVLAFIWLLLLGVSFWLDLLIIVPILLTVMFIYFWKFSPKENRGFFGKLFGSRLIGVIAIIIVLIVMIFAVYSYTTDYIDQSHNDQNDNDTNASNETVENETDVTELEQFNITVTVYDAFYDATLTPVFPEIVANPINESIEIVSGTPDPYPVPDANIVVIVYRYLANETTGTPGYVQEVLGAYTDVNGQAVFYNMTAGNYSFIVTKTGYGKTSLNIQANETSNEFGITIYPMTYQLQVVYSVVPYSTNVTYDNYEEFLAEALAQYEIKNWPFTARDWLGSVASYQNNKFAQHSYQNFTVIIHANITGGLYVQDLKTINRYDSWYGFTGLSKGSVSSGMHYVKRNMQSVYQSYMSVLQSVLPALQNSFASPLRVDTMQYTGHKLTVLSGETDTGQSVSFFQSPTPSSTINDTVPSANVSSRSSTLVLQQYDFLVMTNETNFNIAMRFETYFNPVQSGYFTGNVTATSETMITDVVINIVNDMPVVMEIGE